MDQDFLRKQVKLAKVCNDDIFYKDFAKYLEIKEHSFYNWLNGEYKLKNDKAKKLYEIVIDLIDDDI